MEAKSLKTTNYPKAGVIISSHAHKKLLVKIVPKLTQTCIFDCYPGSRSLLFGCMQSQSNKQFNCRCTYYQATKCNVVYVECESTHSTYMAEFMVSVGGMPLEQVAGMFDSVTLQHLRQEYGGLQTLLRNHHQVFEGVLC